MYEGYLVLGGNEVVNHARLQAYVDTGYAPTGLNVQVCEDCTDLPAMLGDKPYQSPLIDQAPWFESGNPDTWDFAGVQMLEMTGVSGSTRSATVSNLVGDGSAVRGLRYGGRTIACTALLIGKTGCAVEAGMSWLSQVLGGSNCTGPRPNTANACAGDELCLLSCCPAEGIEGSPIPNVRATDDISTMRWSPTGGFYDGIQGKYEPTTLQAGVWTNLLPNPSFEADTVHWRTGGKSGGPVTGTNLSTNPNLESGALGTAWAPVAGAYAVSVTTTSPISGTYSALTTRDASVSATASGLAVSGVNAGAYFPVAAGTSVTFSVDVKAELAGRRVRAFIQFYDGVSANSNSPTLTLVNSTVAGAVNRISVTEPVPAGFPNARLRVIVDLASGNATPGEKVWYDRCRIATGTTGDLTTYFDGSTPADTDTGYAWTGAANASTSTKSALVPAGSLVRSTEDWPSRWGNASALWTADVAGQYIEADPVPVPSGAYVNARIAVGTIAHQIRARLVMTFLDAASTTVGTASSAWLALNTLSYGTIWQSAARPAATVTMRLRVEYSAPDGSLLATGAQVFADAAMVSADPIATKPIYFDGNGIDSPDTDFAWTGTPNDSPSTRTVTAQASTLTGPVMECYDDAIFDFGIETLSGMVTVTAQAVNADGTTVLWTGEQVTVSGASPAVLILPEAIWGDWRPRLLIQQGHPFTIEPALNHPKFRTTEECADQLLRSYLDVTTIEGPTVVDKIGLSCGEYIYKVEWTMIAANPMILGPTEHFVTAMHAATGAGLSPLGKDFVLAPGVDVGVIDDPIINEQTDCDSEDTSVLAVFDPCCPGFLAPPSPPFVADKCLDLPTMYDRTWIQIPKDYAPTIEDGLMSITVTNDNHNKRGLRIRVYPDPIGTGYQQGVINEAGTIRTTPEECDFCDEFFITYIPANAVWRLDGQNRRITTQPAGYDQQIISSASVRGRGGGPFSFPVMQCNMGYLLMVDIPTAYVENCGTDCIGFTQGSAWVDVSMRRASM